MRGEAISFHRLAYRALSQKSLQYFKRNRAWFQGELDPKFGSGSEKEKFVSSKSSPLHTISPRQRLTHLITRREREFLCVVRLVAKLNFVTHKQLSDQGSYYVKCQYEIGSHIFFKVTPTSAFRPSYGTARETKIRQERIFGL